MSMKQEFTAHDMATAAADGFRDGQRAALDHSAQSLSMVGALVTALDGLLSITQDSAGVAGYHLNGEIAEWGEFPEVITARDVISAYRATDKESLTAADSQASADGSRKLSDLGNELHNLSCHVVHVNEGWAEQIGKIARELWNWPQASAAQSAPAGEREALQRLLDDVRDVRNADDVAFGWDEAAEYFAAAWQRTQSAGVPEGYALVPVEPTPEMVNAALENSTGIDPRSIVIEDYKAMLAAAPAQPAQGEFGDAYQGAREDLAIWKCRALEAEEKVRNAEQSTPAAIEVIGYASPGQVEILRSLPRTGGMKVKGCRGGRYTEPVVLLSAARAALFAAVIRCEQEGAFKTCMECGYQDGHDEICKFHGSNRAAHDHGEVQGLMEDLRKIASQCGCEATTDSLDALLAASAGQEAAGHEQ